MQDDQVLHFDGYRLDPRNACVWHGQQARHLTAKAFTVLHYLVQHAGQLVTKEALFQAVWPAIAVSDAALTICIGEIRKALGDAAQAPRFIATVHRRGYRFIAPVLREMPAVTSGPSTAALDRAPQLWPLATPLVGREAELARLGGWLAQAQRGARQVVLVTGESGIGKTTVVDAFLATAARAIPLTVAWGQCIPCYGAGEAYLPVLDALGRVCRAPGQEWLQALLGQYAPTWLVQMPALLKAGEVDVLQRQVVGATRERMLRELAEALEAMTVAQPFVLVLEDLHWSDHATLDLVTWLARRREPARLLLLGTYRPVDVIIHGHPLKAVKQDLELHRQCVELRLEGLGEAAVAAYLTARFPGCPFPPGLPGMLYQRTEGQPLFLTQVVDNWVQHGWVAEVEGQWAVQVRPTKLETGVPESVRQMILHQFDGCSAEEQRVLEAASVVGVACATALVAVGVEMPVEHVEGQCEALVRRGQFLQAHGVEEWPDGTVGGRYAFLHALHQQVLYERLPVGRLLELHRRIGLRLEAGYAGQTSAQAVVLAGHFDRGRDAGRAVRYMQQAAATALRRYAYQEAMAHLRRALALVVTLPETPARVQQELDLHLALGPALIATTGQAAPEVAGAYRRAWELCQQMEDPTHLLPVLGGLRVWYYARGEIQTVSALGKQCLRLAQRLQDPTLLLEAYWTMGCVCFFLGAFALAQTHLEQGIALALPRHLTQAELPPEQLAGPHPAVGCLIYSAHVLWALGYPEQALQRSHECVRLAQSLLHPSSYSVVFALDSAAANAYFRRDGHAVRQGVEAAMALASPQEFTQRLAMEMMLQGWERAIHGQTAEGMVQIRQGLEVYRATGAVLFQPFYLALSAEVCGQGGQIEDGLTALAEALMLGENTGERWWEAEIYRLEGELLVQRTTGSKQHETGLQSTPEECFHRALDISRAQQARSLELRAAMSLSRLWQRQGKRAAAHELLAESYGWFTEGFDTADLQEAKTLLGELGG